MTGFTSVSQPCRLHAFENCVEFLVTHMKGLMMDIEPVGGLVISVKVERESLFHAHRGE
jgi:hypothetical protein